MAHYNLIFQGEIVDGASLDEVKQNVARLFKADAAKTAALFSGKAIVIKKNLDTEATRKYLAVLKKAGAVVKAVKIEAQTPVDTPDTSTKSPQPTSNDTSASPAGGLSTGLASLINYNKPIQTQEHSPEAQPLSTGAVEEAEPATKDPASAETAIAETTETLQLAPADSGPLSPTTATAAIEIPDIQHLTMSDAQSGSLEEFAKPIEAVELPGTDGLSMSEANTGSLEEFAIRAEPVDLPDISDLDISAMDDTPLSSDSPAPEPAAIPDTSALSMSAANEGSLQGVEKKPEPVAIPDISHLDIENTEEKQPQGGKAVFKID